MVATELAALYRLHAAQCVDLAQRFSDSESKLALLHMAQSWVFMAEQAEKNAGATPIYETPQPSRQPAQQQQPDDPARKE
jgi:hypothetical protein